MDEIDQMIAADIAKHEGRPLSEMTEEERRAALARGADRARANLDAAVAAAFVRWGFEAPQPRRPHDTA